MSFMSFDNMDDMFAFMREQERIANINVTPEQIVIDYDAYWVRPFEDVLIFGYVPTLDQIEADERALGADDEEIAGEREMLAGAHRRGYRYGKAYSVIEPDGEWGSTHISTMIQITKEQYELAESRRWNITPQELGLING